MKAYRVAPVSQDRLWGGTRLFSYGKTSGTGRIAESWELSFTPGGIASVDGIPLTDAFGKETWGERAGDFPRFPVLTKFIDAKENLSVQVHPSDAYALSHEGSYGKTEMWLIVEATPGAGLYLGCTRDVTREEFRQAAEDGTVEKLLRFVPVHPGEVYFIPAGTLHAIGAGVLLYEIQQNSDLTYRVYDYGRRGADGKQRPLHLAKALEVADLSPYIPAKIPASDPAVIGSCPYFTTRFYKQIFANKKFFVTKDSFLAFTVIDGDGTIDGQKAVRGDTFFVPAGAGEIPVEGALTLVTVSLG